VGVPALRPLLASPRFVAIAMHASDSRSPASPAAWPGMVLRGIQPPLRWRDFGLVAFDMDSTLINIECIDEIADAVGRRAEVAAITEAAMRGEIADFKDSLRRRLALLAGTPAAALQQVHDERLRFNPGVEAFVAACRARGLKTLLVSGGFTYFADRVRERLGIDFARSNALEIANGQLTGRLLPQCWGEIVDGAEKRRTLLEAASLLGLAPQQCIAVGDGANDLPMMQAAGLSIAFHAKPAVQAQAQLAITAGGMDQALGLFAD
jgi:phosphoserine phosphatase